LDVANGKPQKAGKVMMLCTWLSSRIFPICNRSQVGIWVKNRKDRPSSAYTIHSTMQIHSIEPDDVPGDSEVVTYNIEGQSAYTKYPRRDHMTMAFLIIPEEVLDFELEHLKTSRLDFLGGHVQKVVQMP
jgi:hypothetical protein